MDDPHPTPRRSILATGAALVLAAAVALAVNPGVPAGWARDAPLPASVTLAVIRAADGVEAAAARIGLDRPAAWAADLRATLGAPE